ncbi:type I-E CRISPR-associated protein Cse1/CasA [Aquabacterium sp.]|uniref:type I-E CRISPR-associated protein Cse1/CasA n=1 Tax=Aquabacterium sp. TaxID=1872578 RepID=UPI0035C6FBAB
MQSLLTAAWWPVRMRDGSRRWIAPDEMSDPDIVSFDADRPDFNGALSQMAIALLTTFAPLKNEREWKAWFNSPPDRVTLRAWWASKDDLFAFDGPGARFMQDLTLATEPDVGVASLFIDSPGENAIKNNSDHFVKRGRITQLCPHCAITGLLTLQVNAPAGGAGHRTGLRGGGPLTTLVVCQPSRSLWHDLWLNVIEPPEQYVHGGDPKKTSPHFTFPWMAPITAIQEEKGETAPIQVHPLHIHWAMPRRIRLDFDRVHAGECDVCHRESERLVSRYATAPYGLNYKGPWDHVLSPYYGTKEGWLPLHPQPGGFGYRHWLSWVLGVADEKNRQRPARIVTHHYTTRRQRLTGGALALWAFGFDMDNMKARAWYQSRLPLFNLDDCSPDQLNELQGSVTRWLHAARDSLSVLRNAVKDAWFNGEARGDFSAIDAAFWSATEPPFYDLLKRRIDAIAAGVNEDDTPLSEVWLQVLQRQAVSLFEGVFVGAGMIDRKNPARTAKAHRLLKGFMKGDKLRSVLALPGHDKPQITKSRATKTTK